MELKRKAEELFDLEWGDKQCPCKRTGDENADIGRYQRKIL